METFLNLVWLAVTVAAIWLWRFRWIVSRRNPRHSTRMEAVAMVCVLALLFPVISLTDDLHPETVAVDAASGKRNACLIAASAPHVRAATVNSGTRLLVGMVSRPFAVASLSVAELVHTLNFNVPCSLASGSPAGLPPLSCNQIRHFRCPACPKFELGGASLPIFLSGEQVQRPRIWKYGFDLSDMPSPKRSARTCLNGEAKMNKKSQFGSCWPLHGRNGLRPGKYQSESGGAPACPSGA